MVGVSPATEKLFLGVSAQGYALCFLKGDIPLLTNAGKGVILQKLPKDDVLVCGCCVPKKSKVLVEVEKKEAIREIDVRAMTIGTRAKRGHKLVKRGLPVIGLHEVKA